MLVGLKAICGFLTIVRWILTPYYWFMSRNKKKVPPITDPLLKISATELAQKVRTKQLTSLEIVTAYINRIKEVNPIINAVVEDRFAAALQEAATADKLIRNTNITEEELEKSKPLLGVPVTIKESCSLQGCSYAVGSLPRAGIKAAADGVAVSNLKEAGAIPLAVTNTPEYCFAPESTNHITGTTCNPYDTTRTAGGSSGGEAALIAAGASIAGIGSDIAGSVRLPALFNGIFGHKPTPGIVSIKGHFPYSSDETFQKSLVIGPLTRYAQDLKLMMKVMAGDKVKALKLEEKVNLKNVTVIYMLEADSSWFVMSPVEQDIKNVMNSSAAHLKNVGCTVRNYVFNEFAESLEMGCSVLFFLKDMPDLLQDPKDPKKTYSLFGEFVKCIFGKSQFSFHALNFMLWQQSKHVIPEKAIRDFVAKLDALKTRLYKALVNNGVFLYPTFPFPAQQHGELVLKPTAVRYTMIFNNLGFPSTHVPLGLNHKGLPIGIQVVARPNEDRLCFAVAEELEKRFGGWVPVK